MPLLLWVSPRKEPVRKPSLQALLLASEVAGGLLAGHAFKISGVIHRSQLCLEGAGSQKPPTGVADGGAGTFFL